jgi:spore coat polysaccharide biosynthesis protein SpsF
MGSTRLPGKVLMPIGNETVLGRLVCRLSRSSSIDAIVVATTYTERDAAIVEECRALGVPCVRGPEDDVLARFDSAARSVEADTVFRITSDCPLIDPGLVDEVADAFDREHADFACNVSPRTYPRGLDTEMFTMDTLTRLQQLARNPLHREHVTLFCYERPDLFRFASVTNDQNYSYHRWTVDTPEDLELVRAIYAHFEYRDDFTWKEALAFLERSPELMKINGHIQQKPLPTTASGLSI